MPVLQPDTTSRRLRLVALVVLVAGLGALTYALLTQRPPEVTPASLAASVENGVGSTALFPTRCSHRGAAWRCVVSDNASAGSATYAVTVDGGSCWVARRVAESVTEAQHMPKHASGCIH